MSSFVRFRGSLNPSTFFDEVIPQEGLEIAGWRLTVKHIPEMGQDREGNDVECRIAWLYAESDYDQAQLKNYVSQKIPELKQILCALEGIRQLELAGSVQYGIECHDFVKDGVCGNAVPHRVRIGLSILNITTKDADGNITYDAKLYQAEQARLATLKAKERLNNRSRGIIRHLGDPNFRRAWESFSLASSGNAKDIGHLYEVRDAFVQKFKKENLARIAVGLTCDEWKEFGKIFNHGSVIGGRHNGMHTAPLRQMTVGHRARAMTLAEAMLLGYCKYLDNKLEPGV